MRFLFQSMFVLMLALFPGWSLGQVAGKILDKDTREGIGFARISIQGTTTGAISDEEGGFVLPLQPGSLSVRISIHAVGYDSLSFAWNPSTQGPEILMEAPSREGVVITGSLKPYLQSASPIKVEVLSREFIRQIPGANNLMDVVDYVTGVRQQINCGVCGTNDIHMNGMEGPYTLVLIDGMPIISALGSVYGLNGIPASLIERIEIVKGPASTIYGSEAMGGVINVILRDPGNAPRLSLESQISSHGEWNADLGIGVKAKGVQTMFGMNGFRMANRIDQNGDNFTDVPLTERVSLFNKWNFDRKHARTATFAAKVYAEDRFGGTLQWQPEHRGSDSIYGENIRTFRTELFGKYQLPTRRHLNLDFSFSHHHQQSWYGSTPLEAKQQIGFANLIHMGTFRSHNYLAGMTGRFNRYDDSSPATARPDERMVPGIFLQDEWHRHERLTLLGGARLDHDPAHGLIFSPWVNVRWKPWAFHTLRFTAGTGFRNVNIFTEEHAALTGSRQVVLADELSPERSFNANLNYAMVFNIGESALNLDCDAFYTYFFNRILPDYDTNPDWILYRNLEGHAELRGVSMKLSQSFKFPLRYEIGATWMQAWSEDESGTKEMQEFVPRLEMVYAASYRLEKLHTTIDLNGRLTGPMDLPQYDQPYARPTISEWFAVHNAQVSTRLHSTLTLSVGVRNLLNFTQDSPLINPSQPFSDSFDTAYAYGPLQGRRFVVGLRYVMK